MTTATEHESKTEPKLARDRRAILVTGSHRSGSTWVGKMLAESPRVHYIHEPFHILRFPCPCGVPFRFWFQYITPENGAEFREHFQAVIRPPLGGNRHRAASDPAGAWPAFKRRVKGLAARARGARPLVKEPLAFFSSEWLASEFAMDVVILIRHPAAFASSLRSKNWTFDFNNWVNQPALMNDYLQPFEAEIRRYAERAPDLLDQAALQWRVIHHVALEYQRKYPEWQFLRHEDLSREPVEEFAKMFARLGLPYDERARESIRKSSAAENPKEAPGNVVHHLKRDSKAVVIAWKDRLTSDEIRRIRDQVEDVACHYYSSEDW